MKKEWFLQVSVLLFVMLVSSCSSEKHKYLIGVSQCSEDSWRSKLALELEQSTYFNEDVELVMCSADDDMAQQSRQIDSLVNIGIDLLIVSPQQVNKLSDAISRATEADIPVILFDRRSDVKNYTAFMGADNYKIGAMLADYAASALGGRGNVVEIGGEHGSSPAIERHKGFNDRLSLYPAMKVIAFEEGDWKQKSGESAMEKILARIAPDQNIDCVFGANDRMALGARKALERHKQIYPKSVITPSTIIYMGIDALPTQGGGIENVRDGKLTASAIYPTHGDEVMQLALDILKGEPYEKETDMETSIVTAANANVLLLQNKEIVNQHQYIKKMYARVDKTLSLLSAQRILLIFIIMVTIVVLTLLVFVVKANRMKHRLNEELQQKNDELNVEKEKVERQRDELEEQRDKLLDVTTEVQNRITVTSSANTDDTPHTNLEVVAEEDIPQNEFMERFLDIINQRLSDADLSVEDIGSEMCLSRVQLYRKVKSFTGKTPVEKIREERLRRANILLSDTSLSVSEVAYKVGFSAPSYFAKCYKAYYGKAPSEK